MWNTITGSRQLYQKQQQITHLARGRFSWNDCLDCANMSNSSSPGLPADDDGTVACPLTSAAGPGNCEDVPVASPRSTSVAVWIPAACDSDTCKCHSHRPTHNTSPAGKDLNKRYVISPTTSTISYDILVTGCEAGDRQTRLWLCDWTNSSWKAFIQSMQNTAARLIFTAHP